MTTGELTRRTALGLSLAFATASFTYSTVRHGKNPNHNSDPLVIASGQAQGVYSLWANTFAETFIRTVPGSSIKVLETAGSQKNLSLLRCNDVNLAIATLDTCTNMDLDGTFRLRDDLNAVSVARLYDDFIHLLVRADSKITDLGNLRGQVAIGAEGSGTALIARRILDTSGVRDTAERQLNLTEGLRLLLEGTIEAVFWSGGLPTSALTLAWGQERLKLIPLDKIGRTLHMLYPAAYRLAAIPAGTYGDHGPVPTFAVPNILLAGSHINNSQIESILSVLFSRTAAIASKVSSFEVFDARIAIHTEPIPMHSCAMAFYRAMKP